MWLWGLGILVLIASIAASRGLEWLIDRERRYLQLPPTRTVVRRLRPVLVVVSCLVLTGLIVRAELTAGAVATPEVQPSANGQRARVCYHACLAILLVLGTAIDLDCSMLPDEITVPGFLIGLGGAVIFQELQIAHLWVDWIYEIPGIRGPYIPEWYDQQRWLHALCWSLAGALAGGVITQAVRLISSRMLGQEAMGFGDVTFMVMIGSFLGWQAILLTFMIAPLTGLMYVAGLRLFSRKTEMPYGPCLAAAALIVLLNWSRLWSRLKLFFSDLVAVGLLIAIALGALTFLLFIVQRLRGRSGEIS